MAKLEKRAWWPDLVRLKDEHSLRELGRRFGVSPAAIQVALKRNGISRQKKPAGRPVVAAVAPAVGLSKPRGRHARRYSEMRLSPYDSQLGRLADSVIAEKAGLSTATVARIRRGRGIDAPSPGKQKGSRSSKVLLYADLLGRVPDAEIARLAGVSRAAVRNFRVRRGIGSPTPPQNGLYRGKQARRRSNSVWLVQASSGDPVVVLAESVCDAVRLAEETGLSPRSIERLPPLL